MLISNLLFYISMIHLNVEKSKLSRERIDFMISELNKLNPDMTLTKEGSQHLLTVVSERFSKKLIETIGKPYLPNELLVFDK